MGIFIKFNFHVSFTFLYQLLLGKTMCQAALLNYQYLLKLFQIVNAKDKQLEVSRSMRVTALAKKKTKFQTLDSFLSVIDETGNTKDISSRCADLDFVMYEELGMLLKPYFYYIYS